MAMPAAVESSSEADGDATMAAKSLPVIFSTSIVKMDVTLHTEVEVRSLGVDVDVAGLLGVLTPGDAPETAWLASADEHAQWAESGMMSLTGNQTGPLLAPPRGMVSRVRWIQQMLAPHLTDVPDLLAVLGERAAIAKLQRGGQTSCGGGTRLLSTHDGWVALCMARPEDVELVPAWLAEFPGPTCYPHRVGDDLWGAISDAVSRVPSGVLVRRGVLLGLAVSALGETAVGGAAVSVTPMSGEPGERTSDGLGEPLLVVDMSSLWAGPLCAHILQLSGALVVKVEGWRRPDGARRGPSVFFDLLHAGQHSVSVDFASNSERRQLARLVCRADVVIEGSRPQALARYGITPELVAEQGRACVWVSITAHGREGSFGERVGFGDDCAVAGALVATDAGQPVFCGDAIADPLAGITAAAATLSALGMKRRVLIDVALSRVARAFGAPLEPVADQDMRTDLSGLVVAQARSRAPRGTAPVAGAQNSMWLNG